MHGKKKLGREVIDTLIERGFDKEVVDGFAKEYDEKISEEERLKTVKKFLAFVDARRQGKRVINE